MTTYSFLDRLLHRLALQVVPISELAFDLDQRMVRTDAADIANERHVFVAGLARAGTTILMRQFHATGAYRSLTYRDMPFVLAPNLWRKLSLSSQRTVVAAERAHGDGIVVDIDSPESLDEVFWRIFAGDDYIAKTHLRVHTPDAETIQKYVRYVNAILHAQDAGARRYLSKNNNNILRLDAIRQAFGQALLLIPFREPLAHAGSLLRQHRHFLQMQKEDRFMRSYMSWLVHHEFGHGHRPFRFTSTDSQAASAHGEDSLEYWLGMWCATYKWLEHNAPKDAIFVCYEDLCGDVGVWDRLAELADITSIANQQAAFRLSKAPSTTAQDTRLVEEATGLYARLKDRAGAALG